MITLIAVPQVKLTGRFKWSWLGKRPEYELLGDFIFCYGNEGGSYQLKVPKGFKYDSASLPRLSRIFLDSADPRICIPSAFHDEAYGISGRGFAKLPAFKNGACTHLFCNREEIDYIYFLLLRRFGLHAIFCELIYLGVRLGGWLSWGRED